MSSVIRPTGTGEEWKSMDAHSAQYRPDDALLARSKASIERHRKRDVTLRLLDRMGRPLAHRPVQVVQQSSSFPVGEQLWGFDTLHRFGQWNTDRGRYARLRFTELFNAANALCYWTERSRNDGPKTEDLQGEPTLEGFAACVDWAKSEGMIVKGHPLFWSIQKCIPEWVKRYDYATQLKFAEVRIRNLVARFKGKVSLWDAVNEAMWEPAFKNLAQRNWPHIDPIAEIADYIEPILRWCRQEDPDAEFLLNDYGLEKDPEPGAPVAGAPASEAGSPVTAARQRQRFLALTRELQQRGSPPSALGLQSHTGGWLDHSSQLAVYDEMATGNVPLHVTEFWADIDHLKQQGLPEDHIVEMQAEYVCNYLTVAFGHPAIEGFFFWGLFSAAVEFGEHSSHELRPLYHRLRKLLREEWRTNQNLVTDAEGQIRFRGFLGRYSLRYEVAPGSTSEQAGITFDVDACGSMPQNLCAPMSAF